MAEQLLVQVTGGRLLVSITVETAYWKALADMISIIPPGRRSCNNECHLNEICTQPILLLLKDHPISRILKS